MNGLRLAALAALLAGVGLLGYAAMQGDVRFGLFLIVPFVMGEGPAAAVGTLLLMAAGVLWFLSLAAGAAPPQRAWDADPPRGAEWQPGGPQASEPEGRRARHGGVVLLGPIPIVWGSDRGIARWMLIGGAVVLVLAIALTMALR